MNLDTVRQERSPRWRRVRQGFFLGILVLLVACGTPPGSATGTRPATSIPGSAPTIAAPTPPVVPPAAPVYPTPTSGPVSTRMPVGGATPSSRATALAVPPGAVVLDLPPGDALLSPDGARIAWTDGDDLCLYTSLGQRERCVTPPDGVDPDSLSWSPDGRYLAFTENFYRFAEEPDIWVLDAAAGAPVDLTEDGVAQAAVPQNLTARGATLDVLPVWLPDNRLIFLRHLAEPKALRATIWIIGLDGRPPVQLGVLDSVGLEATAFALPPDGKTIAYNRGQRANDPTRGVWSADLDGRNARLLLGLPDPGAAHLAFSSDGRFVLARLHTAAPTAAATGGTVRGVGLDGTALDLPPAGAFWAAWSPTNASIAYVVRNTPGAPDQDGLYVVTQPDHAVRRVQAGAFLLPAQWANGRLLTWSGVDTVLLALPDHRLVLLRLT